MRRKNSAGCPCCGESVKCGIPCSACGGIYMLRGGTLTDDSGTYPLYYGGDGDSCNYDQSRRPQWCTSPLITTASLPVIVPHDLDPCEYTSKQVKYAFGVGCTITGQILFSMLVPGIAFCPLVPCMPGYIDVTDVRAESFLMFWRDALSTSLRCEDGVITASATYPDLVVGLDCPDLPATTRNVSVSIPIDTGDPEVCCNPCPIPKQNLTLSWGGGSFGSGSESLIYDPVARTWTCKHIFPILGEILFRFQCDYHVPTRQDRLTLYAAMTNPGTDYPFVQCQGIYGNYIGTCTGNACLYFEDFSCRPFHAHFVANHNMLGGQSCYLFAYPGTTYITDIYIDE